MSEEIQYKGFIIIPNPEQLTDSGQWTTYIYIQRHWGSGVSDREFHASTTYNNREEAIIRCFEFGKRIIDGTFPDLIKNLP
ncbi:MAG: HlyU family transcriptional regulator [Deltaproteobacteria bacterium]|nr:HlyU family transcriptional regulator [Deltaproteobacteria bacterium]